MDTEHSVTAHLSPSSGPPSPVIPVSGDRAAEPSDPVTTTGTSDLDTRLAAAYARLFDEAEVGLAVVGRDGRVVRANQALSGLTGHPLERIVGHEIRDLVLPEYQESMDRWLVRCWDGRAQPVHVERWIITGNDERRWVATDMHPVMGSDGEVEALVLSVIDATGGDRALQALGESEHRWRTLVQNISDTVSVIAADGTIVATTGQVKSILGYPRSSWVGRSLLDLLHPDDLDEVGRVIDRVLAEAGTEVSTEARVRRHDGAWADVHVSAVNLIDDPAVEGVVLTTRNITDHKRAERLVASQTEILELIARGSPLDDVLEAVAAMIEDHDDGSRAAVLLLEGNRLRPRARVGRGPGAGVRAALGDIEVTPEMQAEYSRDHGVPVVVTDVDHPDERGLITEALLTEEIRSLWWAPVRSRIDPRPVGIVMAFHPEHHTPDAHAAKAADVACTLVAIALERHATVTELAHRSLHDDLTGLPNRTLLLDRMHLSLERAARRNEELGVLYVDLDRFKMVNDSLGHVAGDAILVSVAERLRSVTRPGDTIARVGADEFVIVCDRPGNLSTILSVAARLTEIMKEPFAAESQEVFLTVSLGLALSTPGIEAPVLLREADSAMFRAKQRGRNRLEMYDPAMQARAHDRLALGSYLRRAIDHGELRVVYQPIVDLETGRTVGAEALLRWDHPERGDVPPAVFVPLAEETGSIVEIGAWVLDTALAEMSELIDPTEQPFILSVNLSTRQLDDPALVPMVNEALRAHSWPAASLCLELTETALNEDLDSILRALIRLRATGVAIAVDDFGTGYSSLTHLQRLPVDNIKIDRSFVQGLGETGSLDRSTIAAAVLGIAAAMGLDAVAEGVETPAQLNHLRELGCRLGQGYLFSQPVPAEALRALLRAPTTVT